MVVDQWCPVTNPFTHMQHGHIRVLLAMGIEQQVSNLFSNAEWHLVHLALSKSNITITKEQGVFNI